MNHVVAAALALLLTGAAQAQVYKCPGANGRTVYSDRPCARDAEQLDPAQLRGNTVAGESAAGAASPAEATGPAPAGAAGNCPSPQEIRNLETSASSTTLGRKEREFLQAEVRRARACAREGGTYTDEDWRRIREAQSDQNRIDRRDRERARAKAEDTHAPSVSPAERERMDADRRAEAARQERRSRTITRCDATACWDRGGRRYARLPDGRGFSGEGMQQCSRVGDVMQCD